MTELAIPTSVTEPLLYQGDCIDLMRRLPPDSIDAVVDDPPAGIGFMGKAWDSFKAYEAPDRVSQVRLDTLRLLGLDPWAAGFVAFMADCHAEAMRVMKPGAYVLVWALPKTAELAGLALRLAGFDICDSLVHLFGSGMKKGLDVGKAIDEMHGADREVVGSKLSLPGYHLSDSSGTATALGDGDGMHASSEARARAADITAPATPDAQRWDGYHTGLAPGHEQWLLARKPTRLTYAKNVLEHGCGALHIAACKVPLSGRHGSDSSAGTGSGESSKTCYGGGIGGVVAPVNPSGRWPANVILSTGGEGCPAEAIDAQSGIQKSGVAVKRNGVRNDNPVAFASALPKGTPDQGHGDLEFRARYQAKASDRRAGLRQDIENKHPTHKHPALMRWLQRLVTPTAKATGDLPGVVLSRFLGSGTDGVAAVAEGFRFIGAERDPEHFAVARSRIMAAIGSPEAAAEANKHAPKGGQLGLL